MRLRVFAPLVLLATAAFAQTTVPDACPTSDPQGRFESAIRAAAGDPTNPSLQHVLATFYFERSRDSSLTASQKRACLDRTVTAENSALALDADFFDALVYKNLALRALAASETDAAVHDRLIAEADALRAYAISVRSRSNSSPAPSPDPNLAPPPPPPPPPVDSTGEIRFVYAQTSFTASGNAQVLEKVKDVRPVFPPVALASGIQGTVVVEAAVDRQGRIVDARIVESVPLLDQSAIDAIRQWQFDPATVAPTADRVVLTVRATFIPPR